MVPVCNHQNPGNLLVYICSVSMICWRHSCLLRHTSQWCVFENSTLWFCRSLLETVAPWEIMQTCKTDLAGSFLVFLNLILVERARHDYIDEFLLRLVYSSFNVRSLVCHDGSSPQAPRALKHKSAFHFAADAKTLCFTLHLERKLFVELQIPFNVVRQITVHRL